MVNFFGERCPLRFYVRFTYGLDSSLGLGDNSLILSERGLVAIPTLVAKTLAKDGVAMQPFPSRTSSSVTG